MLSLRQRRRTTQNLRCFHQKIVTSQSTGHRDLACLFTLCPSGFKRRSLSDYNQLMLSGWYRDVVLGLRSLRKNPVLSLTAVLTLALGIGANTPIFTLLYGLVLRSLLAPDESHLVRVVLPSTPAPIPATTTSYKPV